MISASPAIAVWPSLVNSSSAMSLALLSLLYASRNVLSAAATPLIKHRTATARMTSMVTRRSRPRTELVSTVVLGGFLGADVAVVVDRDGALRRRVLFRVAVHVDVVVVRRGGSGATRVLERERGDVAGDQ